MDKKQLAIRIKAFLDKYAAVLPDFNESDYNPLYDSKYTSPDAHALLSVYECIMADLPIFSVPFSSWGSGGYKPYTSEEGRTEHEAIIEEITKHIS